MIKVRITTPERTTLTEAGHVDVALYGNDDKIQIMVTMGVYFYEAQLVALDETAKKEMPNVFRKMEMVLREAQPRIEIDVFDDERLRSSEMMRGKYGVTVGKAETLADIRCAYNMGWSGYITTGVRGCDYARKFG